MLGQITSDKEEMTSDDWGKELLPGVVGGEVKFTTTMKVQMQLGDFPFDVQDVAESGRRQLRPSGAAP